MRREPLISVIMPVYNSGQYLAAAVKSILDQTVNDFEFIIIDDASTDNSLELMQKFKDQRIVYLKNNSNMGVAETLNRGMQIARGKFIARMDADDISLRQRFQKQIGFFNHHPGTDVLGTWVQCIDEKNKPLSVIQPPLSHASITWNLLFGNCLDHASVMFRNHLLKKTGGYSVKALHYEDYDLWARVSHLAKLANLGQILLHKRIHSQAIASRFIAEQNQCRIKIIKKLLTRLLKRQILSQELKAIDCINKRREPILPEEAKLAVKLLKEMLKIFLISQKLSRREQKEVYLDALEKIWFLAKYPAKPLAQAVYDIARNLLFEPYFIYFAGAKLYKKTFKR